MLLPTIDLKREANVSSSGAELRIRGINAVTYDSVGSCADFIERLESDLIDLIRTRGEEIIDDSITRRSLDYLERVSPDLVAAVIPSVCSVTQLTTILKRLILERVPIRNFDCIVQAIAETGTKTGERYLVEQVRIKLRRVISQLYADEHGKLNGHIVDPILDLCFVRAEKEQHALSHEALEALFRGAERVSPESEVVVASRGARGMISDCLYMRGIARTVLAFEEIAPEKSLEVKATISLDRAGQEKVIDSIQEAA